MFLFKADSNYACVCVFVLKARWLALLFLSPPLSVLSLSTGGICLHSNTDQLVLVFFQRSKSENDFW